MRLEKPYRNRNISLKNLAEMLDLSQHQLSELINVQMQKNFASFINYYRVEEAKEKLRTEPDISIREISILTGYQSVTAFNRAFKKETGQSPTDYRKNSINIF